MDSRFRSGAKQGSGFRIVEGLTGLLKVFMVGAPGCC